MTAISLDAVAALAAHVRDAAARGASLRIAGRGTWLDAGRPTRATETIATRELSGIVSYVPGDLTLTARAGTTLGEIRAATSAHAQRLALDPFGSDDGTVGATVATASAGPLAAAFGTPRDLVLGLEAVTGAGSVVRGGGRVVKNVAGFDLTRLFTGSWGTLGIITEVTVRLHAVPEAEETYAIAIGDAAGVGRARLLLRRLPFAPLSCEILNEDLSAILLGGARVTALFRLGGNAEAVAAQRAAIGELGEAGPVDPGVWERLRQIEPGSAIVFRLSHLPSEIERTWTEAAAIASACRGTLVHSTPSRGIVRCILPATDEYAAWLERAFGAPSMTTRIGERLPPALWAKVPPAVAANKISANIKRTFDPDGVLNAGIFGEGT